MKYRDKGRAKLGNKGKEEDNGGGIEVGMRER